MAILGIMHTESDADWRFKNWRRSVIYQFPNGSAPLTAIMSLLGEEVTNDPQYYWHEDRHVEPRTTTAAANANGPFTDTGTTDDKTVGGFNITANDVIRVKTAANGTDVMRVGNTVRIDAVPNGAGTATHVIVGRVVEIVSTSSFEMRVLEAFTSVSNDTDANDLEVLVIGYAAEEAQLGAELGAYSVPVPIDNVLQTWREPFRFSGDVLKTGLKFDKTGPYKTRAKKAMLSHFEGIERSILFGVKSNYPNPVTGLMTRTTGGILHFLKLWEAGSTYGNTAATSNSDDNKRIIDFGSTGQVSLKDFHKYLERVFRVCSSVSNEKLVLCGNGALQTVNDLYFGRATLNVNVPMTDTFGMDVVGHKTPFGQVWYKTHPLFNSNPTLRNAMLFLDVHNLKWRYMRGRDTTLKKMQQPRNADYREDEWFTQGGLELQLPESCMFMKGMTTAIA